MHECKLGICSDRISISPISTPKRKRPPQGRPLNTGGMGRIELEIHPIVLNDIFVSSVFLSTRKVTRICCTALRFSNAEFSAIFCSKISQPSVAFLRRKVNLTYRACCLMTIEATRQLNRHRPRSMSRLRSCKHQCGKQRRLCLIALQLQSPLALE